MITNLLPKQDGSSRAAIGTFVSNALVNRWNQGRHSIPQSVLELVNHTNLEIRPSLLLSLIQENDAFKSDWAWQRLVKDSKSTVDIDSWIQDLVSVVDPEQLKPRIRPDQLLLLLGEGFNRTKNVLPLLILLGLAKERIEAQRADSSGTIYNNLVNQHKEAIAAAVKSLEPDNQ